MVHEFRSVVVVAAILEMVWRWRQIVMNASLYANWTMAKVILFAAFRRVLSSAEGMQDHQYWHIFTLSNNHRWMVRLQTKCCCIIIMHPAAEIGIPGYVHLVHCTTQDNKMCNFLSVKLDAVFPQPRDYTYFRVQCMCTFLSRWQRCLHPSIKKKELALTRQTHHRCAYIFFLIHR